MNYTSRFLAVLLLLLAAALPATAAPPSEDVALTVEARPVFDGTYRAGSWVPVEVTVENAGADRSGEVRIGVPRSATFYAARLDLPRGARKVVTVYARIDSPIRRLDVSFVASGEALSSTQLRLDPHTPNDLLVGVLAPDGAGLRLPAERARDNTRLIPIELSPSELPEQALGLQMFTALVIDNLATEGLSAGQHEALLSWVAQGGRLVLGGGEGARATLAGLPEALRPVELGDLAESNEAAALGHFAGVTPPVGPLVIVQASPREGSAIIAGQSSPLLVERSVGRGRVAFLALPLNSPALAAWPEAPAFWVRILRPTLTPMPVGGWAPGVTDMDEFRMQSVASTLTNLPSLDLPSLWLPGGLIVAYILLVGPLAYLVLRRLDRQALGWIVLPVITLLFSAAAYAVGYSLRGGDIVLNQVNVVEPLLDDQVRVRSFVGIFSPSTRSYDLAITGQPVVRPVSLFGPWGGPEPSKEDGVFVQQDSGVSGLTINQWSMRGIMAESVQPLGTIESRITYAGGRFEGEVVNNSSTTLRNVILVRGADVARLGDIPAGARRAGPLEQQADVDPGMSLGYIVYKDEMVARENRPPDREIQRRQGLIDSLFSNGPFPRGGEPLLLAWLDTTPHQVTLSAGRVDARHLTLYSAVPKLMFNDNALDLASGWAQLQAFDANGQPASCYTPQGQGFATYNGDVEATLRLPEELRELEVSELALVLDSDGPWPQKSTLELFDLHASQWMPLDTRASGRKPIPEWERYLDPAGVLRLRFSIGGAPAGSCILADLSLKGTLP